jgi:hypothetical protein
MHLFCVVAALLIGNIQAIVHQQTIPQQSKEHAVLDKSQNFHSYSNARRAAATLFCFEQRFALPQFSRILSYGCADGFEVEALRQRYAHAFIVGTDILFAQNSTLQMRAVQQWVNLTAPNASTVPSDYFTSILHGSDNNSNDHKHNNERSRVGVTVWATIAPRPVRLDRVPQRHLRAHRRRSLSTLYGSVDDALSRSDRRARIDGSARQAEQADALSAAGAQHTRLKTCQVRWSCGAGVAACFVDKTALRHGSKRHGRHQSARLQRQHNAEASLSLPIRASRRSYARSDRRRNSQTCTSRQSTAHARLFANHAARTTTHHRTIQNRMAQMSLEFFCT